MHLEAGEWCCVLALGVMCIRTHTIEQACALLSGVTATSFTADAWQCMRAQGMN